MKLIIEVSGCNLTIKKGSRAINSFWDGLKDIYRCFSSESTHLGIEVFYWRLKNHLLDAHWGWRTSSTRCSCGTEPTNILQDLFHGKEINKSMTPLVRCLALIRNSSINVYNSARYLAISAVGVANRNKDLLLGLLFCVLLLCNTSGGFWGGKQIKPVTKHQRPSFCQQRSFFSKKVLHNHEPSVLKESEGDVKSQRSWKEKQRNK